MTPKAWQVMNAIFFGTLAAGYGFGYVVGDKSIMSGVAGVVMAMAVFFVGAMTALLKSWCDQKKTFESYSDNMKKVIEGAKVEKAQAVQDQRRLCAEAVVEMSKATVGRVVDRVLAEHPVLAMNQEQLEAATEDAKAIVVQELEALEDAVVHQCG